MTGQARIFIDARVRTALRYARRFASTKHGLPARAAGMTAMVMFLLCGAALPLSAHPLGNFTINHLSTLVAGKSRLGVRYVLDMAEIPTFQAMRAASSDGKMNRVQLAQWGQDEATSLLPLLHVRVAGRSEVLILDRTYTTTRRGAGGLPTLYFIAAAHAIWQNTKSTHDIFYQDATFAGRLGWRDIAVAPAREPTHELTAYPSASISSPRNTTAVRIEIPRDGPVIVRDGTPETNPNESPVLQVRSNQLSDMLARGTTDIGLVLMTMLVAVGLGALHALEPGHGKTLLAISLVGARATAKQALILASALTVAHTIGVLALGVALNIFKGYFVSETIYPWITLCSGVVIAIIGARAVARQVQRHGPNERAAMPHSHGNHVHHRHDHHHDRDREGLEHARSHAIAGCAPLTFGGTVWAAMSGGIAPCPAALVVLLAAIALNQVAYGIFVIIAFSVGLAGTLTGLGLGVVHGAGWLAQRKSFDRFVVHAPAVSAVIVCAMGATMVGQGFVQQGLAISPLAVTAITALAIAGYALSHRFGHQHVEALP